MTIPTISPLPTPPSRADAANFASRADTFLGSLPPFQTEMNAAAAAINALYFPPVFRNALINGCFRLWQRGTSQTTSGYGSDDRWQNLHVGATKTHSRQAFTLGQTAVPGEPQSFSRTVVTSVAGAGNYCAKTQLIEGVRTFAGQSVRVSFWAKADTSRQIALDLFQSFGTGGSPSSTVQGIGAQKFAVTATWARFEVTIAVPSITGKTLGTDGNDALAVRFWFDAGTTFNAQTATLGHQSGTFDLACAQVELGTTATEFELRPPAVELMLAQRYYEVSNAYWTGNVTNATSYLVMVPFAVVKRASPSIASVSQAGVLNGSFGTRAGQALSAAAAAWGGAAAATISAAGFSDVLAASAEL